MATFAAIKALGSAIKNDIVGAGAGIADGYREAKQEREIVRKFREALHENPEAVRAILAKGSEQLNKPARKPRKPATQKTTTTKKGA